MSPLADRAADAWIEGGAGTGGVTRSTRRTPMSSELQGKTVATGRTASPTAAS